MALSMDAKLQSIFVLSCLLLLSCVTPATAFGAGNIGELGLMPALE